MSSSGKNEKAEVFRHVLARFNPRAYDESRQFGVRDWYCALSRRSQLFDRASRGELTLEMVQDRVIDRPLALYDVSDRIETSTVRDVPLLAAWGMADTIRDKDPEAASACALELEGPTPGDFINEPNTDAWWAEVMEKVRADQEESEPRNALVYRSFNDFCAEHYNRPEDAVIEVTLGAPDAVIIEDFRRWLANIRRDTRYDHSPVRQFTSNEFARWVANRALPYLDLTLIAAASGVELHHYMAGDVLFPDHQIDRAEKIRKTVAPLAKQLIGYPMLDALRLASA